MASSVRDKFDRQNISDMSKWPDGVWRVTPYPPFAKNKPTSSTPDYPAILRRVEKGVDGFFGGVIGGCAGTVSFIATGLGVSAMNINPAGGLFPALCSGIIAGAYYNIKYPALAKTSPFAVAWKAAKLAVCGAALGIAWHHFAATKDEVTTAPPVNIISAPVSRPAAAGHSAPGYQK